MNRLLLWLGLPHRYVSTGCLHGGRDTDSPGHRYCRNTTGRVGSKRPAECKFCAAPCRCRCHRRHAQPRLSVPVTPDTRHGFPPPRGRNLR